MNTPNKTTLKFQKPFQQGIQEAYQIITNPLYYPKIHPLITKVNQTGKDQYEFFETTSILGIPYKFQYTVAVDHSHSNLVIMESTVQKGIYLRLKFSIQMEGNTPVLSEEIEIKAAFLARNLLAAKLKKVHSKMLDNIMEIVNLSTL